MQKHPENLTERGRKTRHSLIRAAKHIVAEQGVGALNVLSLCKRAGVGRTSFYNYFKDIPEVVELLSQDASHAMRQQFGNLDAAEPRGIHRFAVCLSFILKLAFEKPGLVLRLAALDRVSPLPRAVIRHQIQDELRGAISTGEVRLEEEERAPFLDFICMVVLAAMPEFADGRRGAADVESYTRFLVAATGAEPPAFH